MASLESRGDVGATADDETLRQRCEQSGSRSHRRLVAWNDLAFTWRA